MPTCGRVVRGIVLATPMLLSGRVAWASDPYEPDNGCRILRHGEREPGHDLEGTAANPDVDEFCGQCEPGRSYEARVTHGVWSGDPVCTTVLPCGDFDLVDGGGSVVTPGVIDPPGGLAGMVVRWVWTDPSGPCYLRARGSQLFDTPAATPYDQYAVEFLDTTSFVPRWNNSGTQITVFTIQNATSTTLAGSVYFYSTAGALLFTQPLNVPGNGAQVFNTASIPALAGQSGVATIVHLGGWGALAGKAVAVEPATGFTFDTPFVTKPR